MCEMVKFDVHNPIPLEYSRDVKEEFQDEYYPDNKVCVSKTTITDTINISNTELNEYVKNDQIAAYEMLFLDHIKTDLPSPEAEVNDTVINNVKIEDSQICPSDTQIEFCNELLFCNHCHEVYQDYCIKCRVLVHILNKRHSYSTYNKIKELPKYMLETRESIGHLGIFSLKVIPEDVRFGPFTGLNSTVMPLRIKGGRFVVSDNKSENLNWMQYINPARNIYEQNLLPFQNDNKLYYCSTRRIQAGEELLIYFGKEYEDNLLKNVEMDFVPITKKDTENVFACILCCLGFSSKEYLAKHKAATHSKINEMSAAQELTQCPFCKIYLVTKEYFEHHMGYCCETNNRCCVLLPSKEVHELKVERPSHETHDTKRWHRGIYKCTQCKFRTFYSADFRHHTNKHYEVKMYKCGICHRRYKTKQSLKVHVVKNHPNDEGRDIEKYTTCDNFKADIKNIKERPIHLHDCEKQCQCTNCKFQATGECHLQSLTKLKLLNRGKYKCANCEFKTYREVYLKRHMKRKHPMEANYKCSECEFETNYKLCLVEHENAKHLKANSYKCMECEFKTSYKSSLAEHKNAKHLKINNYKCALCQYKTYYKSNLDKHIKVKHLERKDYKCAECEYKTNYKLDLEKHMKSKHLKQNYYKCVGCVFKTNNKGHLERHIKVKHLKQNEYKCTECEFKTSRRSYLEKHIKRKHLKQKDYKCIECEYKTHYKSGLENHIKAVHLKQKNYKCTECEYMSNYKSDFEKHIKSKHLEQNDYKCTECEYMTNYKSGLKKHIKSKHLQEYDYKCIECEYMTNCKAHLEVHLKSKHLKQNNYKCTDCEYKTNYKSGLENHKKAVHLKLKNYKCTECEYKANRKSYLNDHRKAKHLKQKDYKCAECEFKTSYRTSLERHMKEKHLKHNDYKMDG